MGPAHAIATGFARSLRFSGRASRSEFWWFALVWLPIAYTICAIFLPDRSTLDAIMFAFFLRVAFCFPLATALVRRGNDAGLDEYWPAAGFSLALFAVSMQEVANLPEVVRPAHFLWFLIIVSAGLSILVLLRVLASPSSPSLNSHEVSQ